MSHDASLAMTFYDVIPAVSSFNLITSLYVTTELDVKYYILIPPQMKKIAQN